MTFLYGKHTINFIFKLVTHVYVTLHWKTMRDHSKDDWFALKYRFVMWAGESINNGKIVATLSYKEISCQTNVNIVGNTWIGIDLCPICIFHNFLTNLTLVTNPHLQTSNTSYHQPTLTSNNQHVTPNNLHVSPNNLSTQHNNLNP